MGLAARLGGISCQLWGSLCCVCAPHKASPAFLTDEVTLSVSLPLSSALVTLTFHPPLCVAVGDHAGGSLHPRRASYQGAASGDVSLLAGARVRGEGWLEGLGEPADAAQGPCTASAVLFLAADKTGRLHASLQEESLQWDMGTVPLLPWIWPLGGSPEAPSHLRCSRPPAGRRDPCSPSSLRSCHSFRAGALELIWDEEKGSSRTCLLLMGCSPGASLGQ